MKPYIGLVHQQAGSAYGITFPDAPGCLSAADSLDDLLVMADEALELWIETKLQDRADIPPPRGLSTIRRDADWGASFADAVLVIAVPSPPHRPRIAA